MISFRKDTIQLSWSNKLPSKVGNFIHQHFEIFLGVFLAIISIYWFNYYFQNHLGLAYNDARSHLDIGRRVVEGLKPGLAQLGSVWLPLPHILMVPTIWNDFMWHSGLSGALQSMISFIITGVIIYRLLKHLGVSMLARLIGVYVFASNMNILYLQSTAMTELLLIATMTIGVYEMVRWYENDTQLFYLVKAAFWIMLSTLVRYDGWFLFFCAFLLVILKGLRKKSYWRAEGYAVFFGTLAGLGVVLWLLWNLLIFKDPLYFAFGPYSAHQQQAQLEGAGVLPTKHDLVYSTRVYWHAMVYNSGMATVAFGLLGAILLWLDKKQKLDRKISLSLLLAPLFFNILALYLGHSVLFIQGISGTTWFNVRYGIMMMPSFAVLIGYLVDQWKSLSKLLVGVLFFISIFQIVNADIVTLDDGRVGSSQKNVSEVSGWLQQYAKDTEGFVLISAASHDAIIFSSGLPMKKFIHEGTGKYWESATTSPDRWAKWIVMRTNDVNDSTFRLVDKTEWKDKYTLVNSYPFADIYELKPEFSQNLNTQPVFVQR